MRSVEMNIQYHLYIRDNSTFCIFFFQFEIHVSWNDYMVDLRNKSRKPECVLTWIGEY
jgi:hypothetical protein